MVDSSGMKNDRMAKRASFGGIVRRTLSDITNSVSQQPKSNPEKTIMPLDHSVKEYIDHLVKENMALARLVADKNKIIELTGTELHKLRLDLQKMKINLQNLQLQNLNLAQDNSHMLAELNIGKERLKVQQHATACEDALLKVKNEELKVLNIGKDRLKAQQHETACKDALLKVKNEELKKEHESKTEQIPHGDSKVKKTRRGSTSKSMGPTTTAEPVAEKEISLNKRRCLRRQSAGVRSQEQENEDNLCEIRDAKFIGDPSVDNPLSNVSSNSEELKSDVFESRRASLSRPSRRAAAKVQSYKETPVNIKMRRPE